MVELVFLHKHFAGQAYGLTQEKTTVGWSRPNDLAIPSASVSASHCEVLVWGNDVIVRDLGSLANKPDWKRFGFKAILALLGLGLLLWLVLTLLGR